MRLRKTPKIVRHLDQAADLEMKRNNKFQSILFHSKASKVQEKQLNRNMDQLHKNSDNPNYPFPKV